METMKTLKVKKVRLTAICPQKKKKKISTPDPFNPLIMPQAAGKNRVKEKIKTQDLLQNLWGGESTNKPFCC